MENPYPRLIQAISNKKNVYPGDLIHYFQVIFPKETKDGEGYHGLTHNNYVAWNCYTAGLYYVERGMMTREEHRDLFVGGTMHDHRNRRVVGDDHENIILAIESLRANVHPTDQERLPRIEKIIWATCFPHIPLEKPTLAELIIRDVDVSQCLGVTWMQPILVELAKERNTTPMKMLESQEYFMRNYLDFKTEWAKAQFPQSLIEERIEDVQELLYILKKQNP